MSGMDNFWWKIVESSLLSLGVFRDLLVAQHKNNKLALDIVGILQSSDQHSRMGASPFLLGRCLGLPAALLSSFLSLFLTDIYKRQLQLCRSIRKSC